MIPNIMAIMTTGLGLAALVLGIMVGIEWIPSPSPLQVSVLSLLGLALGFLAYAQTELKPNMRNMKEKQE